MRRSTKWALALAAVLLSILGSGASSAHASFTPVRGNVTGTAVGPAWNFSYACPVGQLTGTVASTTTITAALTFVQDPRDPCRDYNSFAAMTWVCRGTATFTSTSSVARVSATGTVSLDTGFICSVTVQGVCTWTISGPQGPFRGWTYDQRSQTLRVGVSPSIAVVLTAGSTLFCGPTPATWTFVATYALSTSLTIS